LLGIEFDRLNVALLARGLQAVAFELLGDKFCGLAMPFAAGIPALQLVLSEKLDLRPPARPVRDIFRQQGNRDKSDAGDNPNF